MAAMVFTWKIEFKKIFKFSSFDYTKIYIYRFTFIYFGMSLSFEYTYARRAVVKWKQSSYKLMQEEQL